MENPSETDSGLGVGVASNGSGNGNAELNTKKRNVTGKLNTKKKNVTGGRKQLTTDNGDRVLHNKLDMQKHYNFNKPINFNFQVTLPESLFSSKKKVEKKKVQEDEDYAYDYEDYEEDNEEDRDNEDDENCYMVAYAFAERHKFFVKPTIE